MSIKVGDLAPEITGTDLVTNKSWSLNAQATADMFLTLAPITSANGDAVAVALQAVWDKYNGKTVNPFRMALIAGFNGTGPNPPAEDPQALKAEIAKAKITFPVVPGLPTWKTYTIPDNKIPAFYCLHWEEANKAYRVHDLIMGAPFTADAIESQLITMLDHCGIKLKGPEIKPEPGGPYQGSTRPIVPPAPVPMPVIMFFLGSPTTDGGGIGIPFGGKPIPIDPPLPLEALGAAGQDVMTGLRVAALSAQLSDAGAAAQVKRAGIEAAKAAINKL